MVKELVKIIGWVGVIIETRERPNKIFMNFIGALARRILTFGNIPLPDADSCLYVNKRVLLISVAQ